MSGILNTNVQVAILLGTRVQAALIPNNLRNSPEYLCYAIVVKYYC